MSDRISAMFQRTAAERRAAFIAYICAGDPDPATSLEICRALIDEGIDLLEIGMPFSDPLADGLTNQLAAERALKAGMTQDGVFELVRRIREFSEVPIVFYTYYNLVFARGPKAFAQRAVAAGVDGILTLDLPPEESADFDAICTETCLKTVYIVAPTTPAARIPLIAQRASGFLYYVSREGVTGVRSDMAADLGEKLAAIRAATQLPVVVGFGISQPQHVKAVAAVADGAVVGSAIVGKIPEHADDPAAIPAAIRAAVRPLIAAC
jgi:tryptophan synthase alpha chain